MEANLSYPTADRLAGIGEYYFSQKLREIELLNRQGRAVINLGIGSPDLPPHPEVIKVLQEESAKATVHAYQSYKGSLILRKAIADWYRTWYSVELDPETEVLPLIGSKEGIVHICMTYLNPGDEVLIPDPGYPTYAAAVKLAGATPRPYLLQESRQWYPDFQQLEKQDLAKVKLMFLNYPHMPTGTLPTPELFQQFVAFAQKHHLLIVHDNPYSFILNEHPASLLSVPGAKEVAIELNSLSKSQNMAGWRVGMLLANKERIGEVLRFKSNMDSGMFLPVQLAAARALSLGQEWYQQLNQVYRQRKESALQLLKCLHCSPSPGQAGMFIWARIPDTYADSYALSDEVLQKAGVFITPGGIFGNEGLRYIRISLCSPAEKIEESLERIEKIL